MGYIYFLISEDGSKTYIGATKKLKERILQHRKGEVIYTKNFGRFKAYLIERVKDKIKLRNREKYWKSAAGRKKLKRLYNKIINKKTAPSSNG